MSHEDGAAAALADAAAVGVQADLAQVAAQHVYYGHQSIGRNILDGVRVLGSATGSPPVKVIASRQLGDAQAPALVEFTIGENGDPDSKTRDFAAVLATSRSTVPGTALFEYCFLDVTPATDIDRMFAAHREAVRAMKVRHPELTFVHVTVPLTVDEPAPRRFVKGILGKPTSRDANRKRNEFNALLRREYTGEPIFDLARVESTQPSGSHTFFVDGVDTVYTLVPEFTADGSHLNAAGRRAAAIELLSVLSRATSVPSRSHLAAR
ncbi:MAG TPA: hypothetical protein VG432_08650 [Gemmatimonadaceae bacterium]|nr:hypothetical protein [Gemmatimonadaceae bacterium]